MGSMDWSVGEYEVAAAQLAPAAKQLVDIAAPKPGETVVDVGCGTGNAALLAAARGASVTGVDPARRLLDVARQRAAADGLDVTFDEGTAEALPLEDGIADLVTSSFGVIFTPDVPAAVAELDRVTGPEGRILVTSIPPDSALNTVAGAARDEIVRVLGAPPTTGSKPFGWHDPADLRSVFEPRGFSVAVQTLHFPVTAPSVQAYVDASDRHPVAVTSMGAIADPTARANVAARIKQRVTELLDALNEDPSAFRVTSSFTVATMRRVG
jgi:SAM-dependent methyltransferase